MNTIIVGYKNHYGLFDVLVIQENKIINRHKNLPEDYADNLMVTHWINYKDDNINKNLFQYMDNQKASIKQIQCLMRFKHKLALSEDAIRKLNKMDASNLLGFCFVKDSGVKG